jgi:EmrB/QacA subfamily drug resistance transporter
MLTLDVTSVGVALDSISEELNTSFAQLQWVLNAYNLTFGAFLLAAGSIADLWGRRRLFTIGVALFTAASLVCGLSQNPMMLNIARSTQGICAAFVLPSGSALIASTFLDSSERAKAFGLFGTSFGIGLAFGPVVGGFLTSAVSWRSIFFINVPIGLAVLALAVPKMCESKNPDATRVDILGVASFSISLFLLIYALINGPEVGWNSPQTLGTLIGAVVGVTLFITLERGQRYPMFDLELFSNPTFIAAQILPVVLAFGFLTPLIYLPLYFQGLKDYSPIQAGLAILPLTIPMAAVPALVGRLGTRFSVRGLVSVGLVLNAIGSLWVSVGIAGTEQITLLGAMLVISIGSGIVNGQADNLAVSVVSPERSGMASGIFNTMRLSGDAITIAAAGAILIGFTQKRLSDLLWGTSVELHRSIGETANQLARGDISDASTAVSVGQEMFMEAARMSYLGALSNLFVIIACVSFIGAVLMLTLIRSQDMFSPSASSSQRKLQEK